ncbi:hypothetical protein J2858_000695 [Neorhizobium galegae]|uniref:DUF6656 family protein n=1 Tax=Neorhizobium galegae TaxID=399 RepID=UPI001AE947E9|nr:hypothetical protein [Neorhizobium galegae]
MDAKAKLRYFDARAERPPAPQAKTSAHSEFLRTGRISRDRRDWLPDERRYLTYEEVAERTERKLALAGEKTHERINAVHRRITFPKLLFSRSLSETPHLGYCHVTAARTFFSPSQPVSWSFYICNFSAEIGEAEQFFGQIRTDYARMYFAVAIERQDTGETRINRAVRGNGVLFRTSDPAEALKNVLMLGAPEPSLREVIARA